MTSVQWQLHGYKVSTLMYQIGLYQPEKLDKCLTNSGGLYSAINNCTTVKQVLDNAATWQQMVKNNLIVYCIEQSDDFMKTLADYPDRLYELVSNEYMQTLMRKSSRLTQDIISITAPKGTTRTSGLKNYVVFSFDELVNTDITKDYATLTLTFNGTTIETGDRDEVMNTSFLTRETIVLKSISITSIKRDVANFSVKATYYNLTKPTI